MDRTSGLNSVVVLGATGSIGLQALEVASHLDLFIAGIAVNESVEKLAEFGRIYGDAALALASGSTVERRELAAEFGDRITFGQEAVTALATLSDSTVINGIVGSAGLSSSVAALEAGNRLALANKESLVAGGPVVEAARISGNAELIPVDSEHSALWQSLVGESHSSIRRLILTASGGPFRGRAKQEIECATVEEALAHPTWDMGPRVTIDSATLMNKAFEVIEAHYLFDVSYDAIDVVVHPQSIIHSLVEYVDGSVKAQLGEPDMRVPIQYAITYPDRVDAPVEPLDLTSGSLTFEKPDLQVFPCLQLGYAAGRSGDSAPAVLNASDEVAVEAFLQGRVEFADIPRIVESTLEAIPSISLSSVDDVLAVDAEARRFASSLVDSR